MKGNSLCCFHSMTGDGGVREDKHSPTSVNKQDAESFHNMKPGLALIREMTCTKLMFPRKPRMKVGRLLAAAFTPCRGFHADLVRASWFNTFLIYFIYLTEHRGHWRRTCWCCRSDSLQDFPSFITAGTCATCQPTTGFRWGSFPGFYTFSSKIKSLQTSRWVTHWHFQPKDPREDNYNYYLVLKCHQYSRLVNWWKMNGKQFWQLIDNAASPCFLLL